MTETPPPYEPPASEVKRGRGTLLWLAIVTSIVAFGPIVSVLIAGTVATHFGCRLDEGSVHPCVIMGHDWGETLYAMGVMGWLMLLTIWLVPVAIALWIWWAIAWFRRPRG